MYWSVLALPTIIYINDQCRRAEYVFFFCKSGLLDDKSVLSLLRKLWVHLRRLFMILQAVSFQYFAATLFPFSINYNIIIQMKSVFGHFNLLAPLPIFLPNLYSLNSIFRRSICMSICVSAYDKLVRNSFANSLSLSFIYLNKCSHEYSGLKLIAPTFICHEYSCHHLPYKKNIMKK